MADDGYRSGERERSVEELTARAATLVPDEHCIVGQHTQVDVRIGHVAPQIDRSVEHERMVVGRLETDAVEEKLSVAIDDAVRRKAYGHVAALVPHRGRIEPHGGLQCVEIDRVAVQPGKSVHVAVEPRGLAQKVVGQCKRKGSQMHVGTDAARQAGIEREDLQRVGPEVAIGHDRVRLETRLQPQIEVGAGHGVGIDGIGHKVVIAVARNEVEADARYADAVEPERVDGGLHAQAVAVGEVQGDGIEGNAMLLQNRHERIVAPHRDVGRKSRQGTLDGVDVERLVGALHVKFVRHAVGHGHQMVEVAIGPDGDFRVAQVEVEVHVVGRIEEGYGQ